MLNDKELNILNSIYQLRRPTTLEELATVHKLSPRSIRSYIARINKDFGFECVALHKGVYEMTDLAFLDEYFQDYQVSNYSAQVLVVFMLHKLALENKINLSHFVVEFEVSRTTAKNYLNQVKEQLEEYHLSLDHSTGITLLGKESDKRRLILDLFLHFHQRHHIEAQLVQPLFHSYEYEEMRVVLKGFLQELLSILGYTLSEHSHQVLLSYLVIALGRNKVGFLLHEIDNQGFLQNSTEFQSTSDLFQELEGKIGRNFTLEDKLEVINKVMGLHYSTNKEEEHHNWFEYDLFISKLIRRFSKECGYNLVGDFTLYENLLNHIKPAMYRIAHHIKLHQFDFQYIIDCSQEEFAITTEILRQLHFFPSDNEIPQYQDETALICVYFKQALEKLKMDMSKSVLLVSNYGYGSTKMMMEKLQQLYHISSIQWIPSYELNHIDLHLFDLLVTTDTQIERENSLPVVNITPFFEQEDRHKLAFYLSPKEMEKISLGRLLSVVEAHCTVQQPLALVQDLMEQFPVYDDRSEARGILDFMAEENILLDISAKTVNEVLYIAGKMLEKNGYIHASYTQGLIESFENYGVYMMIDTDVAIPHTKNTGNVLKTGFTFLRVKEPIHFENHALTMFFTFCTRNNKEHLEALVLIAEILKDEQAKKSLQTLGTAQEILHFLNNNAELES